jgi:hypothetical protein
MSWSITIKLLLILVLALTGCTGMRNISSNDPLYVGYALKFDDENTGGRKKLTPVIRRVVSPAPNATFLWMRPAVARNNMLSDKAKTKKFWKNKVKDPVSLSQTDPGQVAHTIQNRIFHNGYFHNTVAVDTLYESPRRAKFMYIITLREPYRFEAILFPQPTIDLTQKIGNRRHESLL